MGGNHEVPDDAEAWRARARRYRQIAQCTNDSILAKLLQEVADATEAAADEAEREENADLNQPAQLHPD